GRTPRVARSATASGEHELNSTAADLGRHTALHFPWVSFSRRGRLAHQLSFTGVDIADARVRIRWTGTSAGGVRARRALPLSFFQLRRRDVRHARTMRPSLEIVATDGAARVGRLTLTHGVVETPAFMPVGTYGSVKAMTPEELDSLGAHIVLGNTFHLM